MQFHAGEFFPLSMLRVGFKPGVAYPRTHIHFKTEVTISTFVHIPT